MDKELKIKISIDKNTGALKVLHGEFDLLEKKTQSSANRIDNFSTSIRNVALGVGGLYSVKIALEGMYGVGAKFTQTASRFEQFSATLKTLEGSSAGAKKSMDWISEFASSTPYELDQITQSFIKLKSYGINPVDGTLKTLGDTASAMGKPLVQAVEAMADAVVGENERLKEFGIRASVNGEKIKYSWINSSNEAKSVVVANNSQIIQSTLSSIFNSKYEGAMVEQSQTFAGMLSNMSDNYTSFQNTIMSEGLYDYVKATTKAISDRFNEMYKVTLANSGEFSNGIIESFNSLIVGTGVLANALEGILITLGVAWDTIGASFDALVVSVVGGTADLIDVLNKIPSVNIDNSWFKDMAVDAAKSFHENIQEINSAFDDVVDYEKMSIELVKDIKTNFKELGDEGSQSLNKINKAGKDTFRGLKNETQEDLQLTKELLKLKKETYNLTTNPYAKLYDSYQANIEKFKGVQEAQASIDAWYDANLQKLNDNSIKMYESSLIKAEKATQEYMRDFESTFKVVSENVYSALDDNFFKALKGQFKDLKRFMKSIFSDMQEAIVSPFMKNLSGNISGMFTGKSSLNSFMENPLSLFADSYENVASSNGGKLITLADGNKGYEFSDGSISSVSGELLSKGNTTEDSLSLAHKVYTNYMGESLAVVQGVGTATNWAMANLGMSGATAGAIDGVAYGASNMWSSAGTGGATGAGAAAAWGLAGYAVGSLGDSLFGAETQAANLGAIGAAVGSAFGPVGALTGLVIGSLIGGAFGSTKVTGGATGVDIDGNKKEDVDGRHWARTDYKKKSWFSSKSWSTWDYSAFDEQTKKALKANVTYYERLLGKLSLDTDIEFKGGRFSSLQNFLDTSLVKGFLANITADVEGVYKSWSDLAKSEGKALNELFSGAVNSVVAYEQGFKEYEFNVAEDSLGALAYKAEIFASELEYIKDIMGASSVTLDNFGASYDTAIKENFTQETINMWSTLGDSLQSATAAIIEYKKALFSDALSKIDYRISQDRALSDMQNELYKNVANNIDYLKESSLVIENLINKAEYSKTKLDVSGMSSSQKIDYYENSINDFYSRYVNNGSLNVDDFSAFTTDYEKFLSDVDNASGVIDAWSVGDAASVTLKQNINSYFEEMNALLEGKNSQIDEALNGMNAISIATEQVDILKDIRSLLGGDALSLSDFKNIKSIDELNAADRFEFLEMFENNQDASESFNIFKAISNGVNNFTLKDENEFGLSEKLDSGASLDDVFNALVEILKENKKANKLVESAA